MADILVISEQRRGVLNATVAEAIAVAKELAAAKGGKVIVAALGGDPDRLVPVLSLAGVDEIISVALPSPEFQSDEYEAAVAALIADRTPKAVLLPHSIDSLGYAPALAAKGGFGFATDVFGARYDGDDLVAVRQAYQEKVHVELEFPGKETVVLTLRSGAFKAPEETASPSLTSFVAPKADALTKHVTFHEPVASDGEDLTAAEYILSIGRGVADEDNVAEFEDLAGALGFTLGCSRPIADNGWLPKYRQVGQSGKTVSACKVYVAMGISGSVQHLAGMKHVPHIIAINKDPEASIFSEAHFGIVGDMFEISKELKAQLG
ncbi:electron transfer flavoprotein subunit alpha/FixB family protein [Hyphomicrobium sp. D-2]|uniref:electron transfer flavoprotein subunit alpha/FixB family protein n=1 Tax=Hyphomicrobium sp. D-2 TaxID=3041621 RepID=UPI00245723EC|nr:electron transfer flavoprotein subunit alpha/FixB family protein [Hyphomicrobium sp. D-2]MDH4981822.1 electron transfer flavoprotein subunit alpha/FixB family protein [Hyphomicrobium sp. D-2]